MSTEEMRWFHWKTLLTPIFFRGVALALQQLSDSQSEVILGLILGLRPANERRRYQVMASLIGWVQT